MHAPHDADRAEERRARARRRRATTVQSAVPSKPKSSSERAPGRGRDDDDLEGRPAEALERRSGRSPRTSRAGRAGARSSTIAGHAPVGADHPGEAEHHVPDEAPDDDRDQRVPAARAPGRGSAPITRTSRLTPRFPQRSVRSRPESVRRRSGTGVTPQLSPVRHAGSSAADVERDLRRARGTSVPAAGVLLERRVLVGRRPVPAEDRRTVRPAARLTRASARRRARRRSGRATARLTASLRPERDVEPDVRSPSGPSRPAAAPAGRPGPAGDRSTGRGNVSAYEAQASPSVSPAADVVVARGRSGRTRCVGAGVVVVAGGQDEAGRSGARRRRRRAARSQIQRVVAAARHDLLDGVRVGRWRRPAAARRAIRPSVPRQDALDRPRPRVRGSRR